jgi:hypothetical protein
MNVLGYKSPWGNYIHFVRSVVFTAATVKTADSWDVTPCLSFKKTGDNNRQARSNISSN